MLADGIEMPTVNIGRSGFKNMPRLPYKLTQASWKIQILLQVGRLGGWLREVELLDLP